MRSIHLFLIGIAVGILSACASSPESHYYHLQAHSESKETFPTDTVIVLEPVNIPQVLRRDQIVSYQKASSEVMLSDSHLWANDLQDMITEATLGLLQKKLINAQVIPIDQLHHYEPNYYLTIRIEELAGPLKGPVALRAHWQISDGSHQIIAVEQSSIDESVEMNSHAGYVLAINRLLDRLSLQTAKRTHQLNQAQFANKPQDL